MPEVDTGEGMSSHSYDFVSRTGIAGRSEREGGRERCKQCSEVRVE